MAIFNWGKKPTPEELKQQKKWLDVQQQTPQPPVPKQELPEFKPPQQQPQNTVTEKEVLEQLNKIDVLIHNQSVMYNLIQNMVNDNAVYSQLKELRDKITLLENETKGTDGSGKK